MQIRVPFAITDLFVIAAPGKGDRKAGRRVL